MGRFAGQLLGGCIFESWIRVSGCWRTLIFPDLLIDTYLRCMEAYVELVVRRSHGSAIAVVFPEFLRITQRVLDCISEGCPHLKRLDLPSASPRVVDVSVICKWKDLEALKIIHRFWFKKVIPEISVHCKKFVSLNFHFADICEKEATTIVTLLPSIECLSFKGSLVERSSLVKILKGCNKLKDFNAGIWLYFDLDDEIRSLASYITTFKYQFGGLTYIDYSLYEYVTDSDSDSDYFSF